MISLWRIFWLETVALWRGWTAGLLLAATVGWFAFLPRLLTADGTDEGFRHLCIRYGLGGVLALLVVTLLAAATGSLASERAARRLQLTQVRPVPLFFVAWGKFLALAALGALVLAVATVATLVRVGTGLPCSHVFRPVMESPREEAEKMYEFYMNDPETPPEVKKAKKSVVLRLLTQRARDNYLTIPTNAVATWDFALGAAAARTPFEASARFRFSNDFDMRQDVVGRVAFGESVGAVSNITKSVVVVPLGGKPATSLSFANDGDAAVMLRPRQDVELLVRADAFVWNLLRAYVEMVSVLALVIAFGVFLGAGLSRPVALFTAFVMLAVSEMSPSVIEQYPDQLETDRRDRIGLFITRLVEKGTRSVSSLSPLARLADDDCVEFRDVLQVVAVDFALLPAFLSALAALLIVRKEEN